MGICHKKPKTPNRNVNIQQSKNNYQKIQNNTTIKTFPLQINEKNNYQKIQNNKTINTFPLQINEKLCQIKSRNGIIGVGFFCRIPFNNNMQLLPVLITSNLILNNIDFTPGNNIVLYFKNSNRYINLFIDNTRKCYSSNIYQLSIIEIKNEDNINNITFLDIGSFQFQNTIKLIYYSLNNNNQEQFYNCQIINFNQNVVTFVHSYNNINMSMALGCPILNNLDNKVIGINITLIGGYNYGMFIFPAIQEFRNKFSKNIIEVIFHDIELNKNYSVKAKNNFMFGELIVYFYFISGEEFDNNMKFFHNNIEIPSYSSATLINLNIYNKSVIHFSRSKQFYFGQMYNTLNIIFKLQNGKKFIIYAHPYMLVKELIMKFCQSFKCPYNEVIKKYRFFIGVKHIIPNQSTITNFGIINNSLIDVFETNII